MADLTRIDPAKLLELAKSRHHDGGVTLSWPTVLQIIDQLRQLQREVGYLKELESHVPACRFHDRDFQACIGYCSTVPCEPRPEPISTERLKDARADLQDRGIGLAESEIHAVAEALGVAPVEDKEDDHGNA